MPKPWAAVASSPEYQSLQPAQQQAARQQYFKQVVAPQIQDPAQAQQAWTQFESQAGGQPQQAQRQSAPQETYDPTEGNSFAQNALIGFGRSLADTGRGVQQAFGMRSQAQIDEDRRLDAPLMATAGGMTGNIVGQAAQIAVPIPGGAALKATSWAGKAAPYVGAAARAGTFGASQGVGSGESRLGNAGKMAALGVVGQGVASATGALARGAASRLDDAGAKLAQKAESFGINLGIPNLSENPFVRTVASQMERLPFSGATKRAKSNEVAFNRQVGKTFGAEADRITPDIFATAKTRLQNGFEILTQRNSLQLDTGHVGQIKTVLDEASRLGGSDTARMVRGWADELMNKVDADGVIPGKAYQSFDSRLAKVLKSGGEPAHYLGQLRDVVRAAMDDSISAGDRTSWNLLRKQYAAMKTVEPLVAKSPTGNISPQALMGRVTSDNAGKARMAGDKAGALGDLARIGQRFLKEAPNSGSADRGLVNLAVGGGLFEAQRRDFITPETALYTGGLLLGNRVGLNALNSRAIASGNSRSLKGLARLMQPSPRVLPAIAGSQGVAVSGGRVATREDMERDAEIVRKFRAKQGR